MTERLSRGSRFRRTLTYDEYDAFADDEGVDDRLRADVADALGEKQWKNSTSD